MRTKLSIAALGISLCPCHSAAPVKVDAADVPFAYRVIDPNGPYEMHVTATGDLSGDGKPDVVAAGTDGLVVWYEWPSWTRRAIAQGGGGWSTEAQAADIDGDGDNDLVISDWYRHKRISWFENRDGSWLPHPIGPPEAHDVKVADLDGDGDIDVVTRRETFETASGHTIEIHLQQARGRWLRTSLQVPPGEGLHVADMDGDRDPDIIISGRWYENTGQPGNAGWPEHVYTTSYRHAAAFPYVGDINRDGVPDILLTPAKPQDRGMYRISWFEGVRGGKGLFREHMVADGIETVQHSIGLADFDLDGDLDIMAAEMHQSVDPDEVNIYLNKDGAGKSWRKQTIATTGSHFLRVADIGGDGDPDLVGANWAESRKVELWENLTRGGPGASK
jgi:hypothetical protein